MPHLRISEAASLLGVSDDTVRRWIDAAGVATVKDGAGRLLVDGVDVASYASQRAAEHTTSRDDASVSRSARNQFVGIVTRVVADTVMAQVELQCGPHRVVSLMSTEAVQDLGLEPGVVATAVVKATTVIVERPRGAA
ncbi:molybdopterin-binding protein [Demequina sp. NBRC 110051]|uniref:TOBE domain-containing protein n=1 Tax=Demequina sp. NBRC 110051 TaxID=1570340 RepID=UPI000A017CAD|nr:TOBE domain-containing protein [Demequina sp. NBRC 110051]